MFRYFLYKEKIRTRLLSFPDGERRLTNVLHLGEVLHRESSERKLGVVGLLKWLRQQLDPESPRLEEHQLRLESDANAVKIVTIHKSKGLEYPIVFCPFNWEGSEIGEGEEFLFHDPKDEGKLNLVLNPEENPNRMLGQKEILAENLRLLYVSLTRARNRCYLVWGRFNDAETRPLPIFSIRRWKPGRYRRGDGAKFEGLTDADIRGALISSSERERDDSTVRYAHGSGETQLPGEEGGKKMIFSRIPRPYPTGLADPKFFPLVSDREKETKTPSHTAIDLPDYDQGISMEETIPVQEPSGIFAFPKGARPGTFLHDIFEQIDFAGKDTSSIGEIVAKNSGNTALKCMAGDGLRDARESTRVPLRPGRTLTLSSLG